MSLRLSSSRAVEVAKFTAAEKSASSSQQYQVHVERFFDIQGSVHKEFAPLVKPSMASFTVRFWSGWGRAFGANVQTSGRKTIGFSTMAACPLTHHSMFDKFLTSKNIRVLPHPPYSPDHTLFPIPQYEITAERVLFWHDWGDPRRIARGYTHTHVWELPGMHEIMGNTLRSLYTCQRGLFWRRRWKLGVLVRNFILWSNSPYFWVAPRIHTLQIQVPSADVLGMCKL